MVGQVNVAVPQGAQVNLRVAGGLGRASLSLSFGDMSRSLDQQLGTVNISYNGQSQKYEEKTAGAHDYGGQGSFLHELLGHGSGKGAQCCGEPVANCPNEVKTDHCDNSKAGPCEGSKAESSCEAETDQCGRPKAHGCGGSEENSTDEAEANHCGRPKASGCGGAEANSPDDTGASAGNGSSQDSCGGSEPASGGRGRRRYHPHAPIPPGTTGASSRSYQDFADQDDPSGGPQNHRDKVDEYGHVYTWDSDFGRYEACGNDDGHGNLDAYNDEEYASVNNLNQQAPANQSGAGSAAVENAGEGGVNVNFSESPGLDVTVNGRHLPGAKPGSASSDAFGNGDVNIKISESPALNVTINGREASHDLSPATGQNTSSPDINIAISNGGRFNLR